MIVLKWVSSGNIAIYAMSRMVELILGDDCGVPSNSGRI